MSGGARDFNNIETRVVNFLDKRLKEIHAILTETLREHAPPYPNVKNGAAHLNMVIFPPVLRLVLDDRKQ